MHNVTIAELNNRVMTYSFETPGPTRDEVDASIGPLILEFGTDWCGHCQAATPIIADACSAFPSIPHVRVEDGPGRRLGRSFRVTLWPTIIVLNDGVEVARFVRPDSADGMRAALAKIT